MKQSEHLLLHLLDFLVWLYMLPWNKSNNFTIFERFWNLSSCVFCTSLDTVFFKSGIIVCTFTCGKILFHDCMFQGNKWYNAEQIFVNSALWMGRESMAKCFDKNVMVVKACPSRNKEIWNLSNNREGDIFDFKKKDRINKEINHDAYTVLFFIVLY